MTETAPPGHSDEGIEQPAWSQRGAAWPDVEEIARLVYQLMLNDLAIGRERGG
jgi:hypothetical protein